MSKYCPECGYKNKDESHFCIACGAHLIDLNENLKNSSNLDNNENNDSNYNSNLNDDESLFSNNDSNYNSNLNDDKSLFSNNDSNYNSNLNDDESLFSNNDSNSNLENNDSSYNSNLNNDKIYSNSTEINTTIPQKYADYELLEKDKCLLCGENTFTHLNKKSLLGSKHIYLCTNCGLTFEKVGSKFKLLDINNKDLHIWQKYNKKILNYEEWVNVANGGLTNREIEEQNKQLALAHEEEIKQHHDEDVNVFVQKLGAGEIVFNNVNSSLILKNGESVLLNINNVDLNEPRSVRVSTGGGGGASYRVTNGVTLHSGGGSSRSVSHDEIMNVDKGTLIITNKRVVYTGSKKTINIDLRKILTITHYNNGISIQRENKQKVEYFVGTDKSNLSFTLNGRHQSTPLYGYIVRAAIIGQISNL